MHAVLAHRPEQGLGEAAVTATADHEQVRTVRGVNQRLRRMPVDDQAPHPLAVGRPDFLADHLIAFAPSGFRRAGRCLTGFPAWKAFISEKDKAIYDRILVAVDHSELSDRGVLAARDLATLSHGEVWVLHLSLDPPAGLDGGWPVSAAG
jgi:hypothetical protein